jgi:hypothetical protein
MPRSEQAANLQRAFLLNDLLNEVLSAVNHLGEKG